MSLFTYKKIEPGTYECELNLDVLFEKSSEFCKFNEKWTTFLNSDPWNKKVFKRNDSKIRYFHKSWVPEKQDNRVPVLFIAGNPAPQSTYEDVYYAFEVNGAEHRFWKVLRKIGFIDLPFNLKSMKSDFFELNYASPFRIGIDVALTFSSSASSPLWSGVQGLQKLFGADALKKMLSLEKNRIDKIINIFFKDNPIRIIALQKDAYNMVAQDKYSLKKASAGRLFSDYNFKEKKVVVYGVPPTRWMYTAKMQSVLLKIKKDIISSDSQKKK